MAKSNSDIPKGRLKRLGRAGITVLLVLASRQVWFLMAGIFMILSLWLLYDNVWHELRREAGLPRGLIGDTAAEIDIAALRSITTRRADRVERKQHDYRIYDRLFAALIKEQ